MSLTQARADVNSKAALMASILEHAGHLSSFLEDMPFSDCCRYILYSFSENTRPDIVNAITGSSEVHMYNLNTNTPPCITSNEWVHSLGREGVLEEIKFVNDAWSSWYPDHDVGRMLKSSFDDIF